MKASRWEFTNRALVFGLIIGVSFGLYAVNPVSATQILANLLNSKLHWNAGLMARLVLGAGALLLAVAAFVRTWASSYLNANVVYASDVKSASLVADGPYRHTRNPLYFANILMAFALGSAMSPSGWLLCVVVMTLFCYRLIFREESELSTSQGDSYQAYRRAVPRVWPAFQPRVHASGRAPEWKAGFKAEAWYWGFALGLLGFAVTLNLGVFFGVIAASIALFWFSSAMLAK